MFLVFVPSIILSLCFVYVHWTLFLFLYLGFKINWLITFHATIYFCIWGDKMMSEDASSEILYLCIYVLYIHVILFVILYFLYNIV